MIEANLEAPAQPARHIVCLPQTSTVVVVDAEGLAAIQEPGVNMCVWLRSLPEGLEQYVDAVVVVEAVKP